MQFSGLKLANAGLFKRLESIQKPPADLWIVKQILIFHNTKQCLYGINHFLFFWGTIFTDCTKHCIPPFGTGRQRTGSHAVLLSGESCCGIFHSISWISMASGFCVGTSKNGTMDFKICVFLVWIRSSYVMDLFSSMDNTSYIIFLLFYERMPVCMNTIKEKGKNRCMRD